MKLKTEMRAHQKKSELTNIRVEGDIPAVAYSKQSGTFSLRVNGADFNAALRQLEEGHLPTTVFELEIEGKPRKAIVKDIQYHPTSYKVKHLDFQLLEDGQNVKLNVPVVCTGVADCAGIKLGGFLRQVKRHIRVECLPEHIPTHFELSIKELGLKQSLKAYKIPMADNVRMLFPKNEVVVTIAKR